MIICICHRVSDREIQSAARQGCASFENLQEQLSVATSCGACAGCAQDTFDRACASVGAASLAARGAGVTAHCAA